MEIDGLLLTGGNDLATVPNCTSPAPERDRTEFAAIDHCLASDIPILGVCRGLQILGVHAGAQLTTVSNHVATRHTLRSDTDLFPAEVNSYHTLQIQPSTLGQTVQACAFSDDGTIEALADEGFQRVGIMWHPEREESTSLNDIKLFKKVFRVEK